MLTVRFFADNEITRRMGLMHQEALKKNECAFFEFPRLGSHAFWNKNVDFPISLIFCDKNGFVEDVKYLKLIKQKRSDLVRIILSMLSRLMLILLMFIILKKEVNSLLMEIQSSLMYKRYKYGSRVSQTNQARYRSNHCSL